MTMYPFISIQKDFGYSDVTRANDEITGLVTHYFQQSDSRLNSIYLEVLSGKMIVLIDVKGNRE